MPITQLQLQFTYQCFEDLQSRRNDVAICIVAYGIQGSGLEFGPLLN
jgi:hypothetical protein